MARIYAPRFGRIDLPVNQLALQTARLLVLQACGHSMGDPFDRQSAFCPVRPGLDPSIGACLAANDGAVQPEP